MWKEVLLVGFASVVLQAPQAQSAAESVPFPGYLPGENVRAKAPEGDGGPNDIYAHLPVRRPELDDDQVVIYPHSLVFEYGQDPEHHIYEVHSAKELANLAHSKHDKHGKHAHDHHHHDKGTKEAAAKGTPKNLKPAPPVSKSVPPPPPPSPRPAHPHPLPPQRPHSYGPPPPPPHGSYPPPPGAYPPPRPYPYQAHRG
ncbi:uncharacterized protein [Penaeus vannamei]|uniref:uncharacterized protein n=1 Tax=Penaeus vannamei TaxID=6689 RepID=UPI000F6901F0|nr:uncharacterized histidine-rich protein DDB_G0274557-like [Penaeus vannamei]